MINWFFIEGYIECFFCVTLHNCIICFIFSGKVEEFNVSYEKEKKEFKVCLE